MSPSSKPRMVKCVETGEIFPSVRAVTQHYKITASNLCRILNHNLTENTLCGYHWEAVTPRTRVFYQLVPYEGEVVNFSKIPSITAYLDVNENQIYRAIKQGTRIDGYRIVKSEELEDFGEDQPKRIGHKFC